MISSIEKIHQTISHGKKTFPFSIYHVLIPDWMKKYPFHWHDEFEMIYILKGKGIFSVNGFKNVCQAGDLIIVPPGSIHSIDQNQNDFVEYFNIIFSLSLLEENPESQCFRNYLSQLSKNDCMKELFLRSDSPVCKRLSPLVCDLISHGHAEYPGYEMIIKARLFEIIFILYNENLNGKKFSPQNQREKENALRLKKVLSYMKEHFAEKITIEEVSEIISLSESRFMTFFKNQTGTSFIKYLNDYRLEASAEQLLQTRKTVTQIALDNGFENISYFVRAFKSKYNSTPHEYRKTGGRYEGFDPPLNHRQTK